MNWQDEQFVKVYTRDTGEWTLLSWDAQALLLQILRKVDRSGVLQLGNKHSWRVAGDCLSIARAAVIHGLSHDHVRWVYGEAQVTPVMVGGYEFPITILDHMVQVGCKTITPAELTAELWPEECCPRLRLAAPILIQLIIGHWAYCNGVQHEESKRDI